MMKTRLLFCSIPALLLAAGCSRSDATTADRQSANARAVASPASSPKGNPMPPLKCGSTEIEKSRCMIELILADIKENYRETGGGGITSIKAGVGMSYSVSLPQEERTDILTYEFQQENGAISIKSRKESTESY